MEQIGFGGDGEKWMAEALGRLAKAGNPAIPPIPPGQD